MMGRAYYMMPQLEDLDVEEFWALLLFIQG